ncbi:hypothetical protein [Stenotrophomonas sp. NPDC077659]|uniref:hypothetical protein n=1 Tax=Stenotrophomonas sp. NPDC077659 TaxID=3390694 RepID=UPI003CFDB4CC
MVAAPSHPDQIPMTQNADSNLFAAMRDAREEDAQQDTYFTELEAVNHENERRYAERQTLLPEPERPPTRAELAEEAEAARMLARVEANMIREAQGQPPLAQVTMQARPAAPRATVAPAPAHQGPPSPVAAQAPATTPPAVVTYISPAFGGGMRMEYNPDTKPLPKRTGPVNPL